MGIRTRVVSSRRNINARKQTKWGQVKRQDQKCAKGKDTDQLRKTPDKRTSNISMLFECASLTLSILSLYMFWQFVNSQPNCLWLYFIFAFLVCGFVWLCYKRFLNWKKTKSG